MNKTAIYAIAAIALACAGYLLYKGYQAASAPTGTADTTATVNDLANTAMSMFGGGTQ